VILLLLRRRSVRLFLIIAPIWAAIDLIVGPLIVAYVTIPLITELAHRSPALGEFFRSLIGG